MAMIGNITQGTPGYNRSNLDSVNPSTNKFQPITEKKDSLVMRIIKAVLRFFGLGSCFGLNNDSKRSPTPDRVSSPTGSYGSSGSTSRSSSVSPTPSTTSSNQSEKDSASTNAPKAGSGRRKYRRRKTRTNEQPTAASTSTTPKGGAEVKGRNASTSSSRSTDNGRMTSHSDGNTSVAMGHALSTGIKDGNLSAVIANLNKTK